MSASEGALADVHMSLFNPCFVAIAPVFCDRGALLRLTRARQSETVRRRGNRGTVMNVRMTAAGLAAGAAMLLLLLLLLVPGTLLFVYGAQAQTAARSADRAAPSDLSAQTRRPRVRIYREDDRGVYPSYNPGPDAVRDCTAHYVQEFRPSGTVIVPRMTCYWRHG